MTQSAEETKEWYRSHFEIFEGSLDGEKSSDTHAVRTEALARFLEVGFPTPRDEEWKFTNVAPIARARFIPVLKNDAPAVSADDLANLGLEAPGKRRLVFIDGIFSEEHSSIGPLPQGVKIGSLARALRWERDLIRRHMGRGARYTDNAFTALNTAFLLDGAFVYVPEGLVLEGLVELLFIASHSPDARLAHPRNLIVAGNNSGVAVVERYIGLAENAYFTNAVTEIVVGEHAVVEHDKVQSESLRAYHVASLHVRLGEGGRFTSTAVALGGSLVRNNVTALFDAGRAECTLNGLMLATGDQLIDNHTTIDHARPECASHELYKSILDGTSHGVFNGKIYVRRDAQKTDAKQTNKTLLLSDDAVMNTKPQLEIFADDVKCTHGATVGQLDEEQVFYLRTRGIDLQTARDMLTYGFARDVIDRINVAPLREHLGRLLYSRLREGRIAKE